MPLDTFPLQKRVELGSAIKRLRVDRGLQQKHVADAIGKSIATVSQIESGKHPLDYSVLITIARFFEVHPLRLIWEAERQAVCNTPELGALASVFDAILEKFEEIGH
jgi:transcriptional regulator with XRE-family HTH domain